MENLRNIVLSLLDDGIELMDLVFDVRSDYVRVVVDSIGDLSIGQTSRIAKRIRNDESILSMFPNGCKLEVGTPGIGVSLSRNFQYKKNIGRKILLDYSNNSDEPISKVYDLVSADDKGINVKIKNDEVFINYDNIISAKIKVSFD
jgi:ribosome maturation factor RimP|tara:strand:+ start:423 stop:860 length:438 start_codon:yes stop_codon:yes gene_type:complete